ncbi:membrane steroid-binding protein 1-like [Vicia villosa]|uniref:membrane steroid-binding protein 1-like n=1 Tax=Vicia villosa TaxID=3911 RepID=UPI00273A92B3|nr:membrane steroid-binding protein 1-like [Vicia villosa]
MGTFQLWWQAQKEVVFAFTGLSPITFYTLAAILIALYFSVSSLFASSSSDRHHQTRHIQAEVPPLRPPVQLGEITEEELKGYDGKDHDKPLLMAIKGQIYDVSQSRMFYGPGGPYALFAGKDASRALARMSFEEKDLTGDISDLGPFEVDALQDWEYKFMEKYVKVGTIKKEVPVPESTGEQSESTPRDVDAVNPTAAAVKSDETPSKVDADKD